ncbi:hypothetical protein [Streptomyces sp. SP18BB07]|uniref:hypothetical protein n=1 Tax=Streptomyces sp. SP18BB07 TaxID=3002522 RepID=UPI002E7A8DC9|nr:hypothetical protein [Streptomyces sp. SP18BB07]MEE1764342.1 hypothetical protein [Streptomyces sp. SP18BB07]
MKTKPLPNDRPSHLLIVAVTVGIIVLGLVLAALLADDDSTSTRHCPMTTVTTVNPATCLPYGSSGGAAAPGTNDSGSRARKPAQKPPAAKVPAAPKAPAAPPRVSMGKR